MKAPLLLLSVVSILSAQAGNVPAERSNRSAVKVGLAPQAVISGIETDVVYRELPPVMVELSALSSGAAVWVEVRQGLAGSAVRRGVTVPSKFYLRTGSVGILNVGGLDRACRPGGTWTLTVFVGDASGTTPLASKTFRVRGGPSKAVAPPAPALHPKI